MDTKVGLVDADSNSRILIRVQDQNGNSLSFQVKIKTRIRKIRDTFANKNGLRADDLRFVFEGERLDLEKTVEFYGIRENELIEVYSEMTGGHLGNFFEIFIQDAITKNLKFQTNFEQYKTKQTPSERNQELNKTRCCPSKTSNFGGNFKKNWEFISKNRHKKLKSSSRIGLFREKIKEKIGFMISKNEVEKMNKKQI